MLSSCRSDSLHLEGTIGSVEIMGHRCWYLATPQLKHYAIYSEDPTLLRDGLKVRMEAQKSTRQTVCNIGILLDVISYSVDD